MPGIPRQNVSDVPYTSMKRFQRVSRGMQSAGGLHTCAMPCVAAFFFYFHSGRLAGYSRGEVHGRVRSIQCLQSVKSSRRIQPVKPMQCIMHKSVPNKAPTVFPSLPWVIRLGVTATIAVQRPLYPYRVYPLPHRSRGGARQGSFSL